MPHSQIKYKTEQLLQKKLLYSIFSLETIFLFSLSILFFLTLSWSTFVYLYQFFVYLDLSQSILVHLDLFRIISVYLGVSLAIFGYLGIPLAISRYLYGYLSLSLAISHYSDYLWLSLTISIRYQGSGCKQKQERAIYRYLKFFITIFFFQISEFFGARSHKNQQI